MTGKWQAENFLFKIRTEGTQFQRDRLFFNSKISTKNLIKNLMKGILSFLPDFRRLPRSFKMAPPVYFDYINKTIIFEIKLVKSLCG